MNILLTINKKQLKQACILISTIRKNTNIKELLNIYIIHNSLSDNDIIELRNSAENICITSIKQDMNKFINAEPSNFPADYNNYICTFAYMLLPKSLNRILYLNYDTIVINNILKFYHSDFKDKALIASQLPISSKTSSEKSYLGLTDKDYFVDTGVMLMNLSFMRAVDFSEKMIDFINSFDDVNRPDEQCIINLFYNGFIKNVNYLVYNLGQSSLDYFNKKSSLVNQHISIDAVKKYSSILHFYDEEKPWMDSCNYSLKKIYLETIKSSHKSQDSLQI